MSAALSLKELARLQALASFEILDTPREKEFDDIASLAARVCGTPIGVVNLIGEGRQFFKAEVGLGVRETPLATSFCARAILEEDFLIVPDATRDPRFACNPLVTGAPHLRFYAGALLKTGEGHPIGTVCVLDYQPRALGDVQIETLRSLALQVMKILKLRRALKAQQANAQRLDLLARASAVLMTAEDPFAAILPLLAEGTDLLGFETSYAYDMTPDGLYLQLRHSVNVDAAAQEDLRRISCDIPLCGLVARSGKTLILDDIQGSPDARHAIARIAGLRAYAGFPILSQGRVAGVISFTSSRLDAFSEDALSFFSTLAHFLSLARERVEAEEKQRILNGEISHRMKNTLAMVQAVAVQTLKGVTERDAVDAFLDRIQALGRANDILLQENWTAAEMRSVAGAVMKVLAQPDRFTLSGPDLTLGPRATLSCSLLLHELGTNAAKHGALGSLGGHVTVQWQVEDRPEGKLAVLEWREEGGPPVIAPARSGFGSRLIRTGLIGTGGAELRYEPPGLRAVFRAPLAQVETL